MRVRLYGIMVLLNYVLNEISIFFFFIFEDVYVGLEESY